MQQGPQHALRRSASLQPLVWCGCLNFPLSPPATAATAQHADEDLEMQDEQQVAWGANEGSESAGGSGV